MFQHPQGINEYQDLTIQSLAVCHESNQTRKVWISKQLNLYLSPVYIHYYLKNMQYNSRKWCKKYEGDLPGLSPIFVVKGKG